jgi:hypothetical protein
MIILFLIIILFIILLLNNLQYEGFTRNPPVVTETNLRLDNTCSDPNQIFKLDRFSYLALPANSNGNCPDNYDRYNYSYRNNPEVFFVNANVTQINAAAVCTSVGTGIVQATFHQLLNSFNNGMNICIDGWVSDKSNFSYLPINNGADLGGGGNGDCKGNGAPLTVLAAGQYVMTNVQLYSNVRSASDTAGVYCYGTKPSLIDPMTTTNKTSIDNNNIAYFNKIKKSMNDNIYCLPQCELLGSNFNIKMKTASDPTICITSNCANTDSLSNTILYSWNSVCAVLKKTKDNYKTTLSNIGIVNSNINKQYHIIDTYYSQLNTTINDLSSSSDPAKNSQYTIALPFLSNIQGDYSNILNTATNSSNKYTTLLYEQRLLDETYNGFACSNY